MKDRKAYNRIMKARTSLVVNHVSRAAVTPACLIYLTDLECNYFPDHPPPYPVLWVKTGGSPNIPPFGELMEIKTVTPDYTEIQEINPKESP